MNSGMKGPPSCTHRLTFQIAKIHKDIRRNDEVKRLVCFATMAVKTSAQIAHHQFVVHGQGPSAFDLVSESESRTGEGEGEGEG